MNHALISVIIPTYGRADQVSDLVSRLAAQSFPVWEAVIVDDSPNPLVLSDPAAASKVKYLNRGARLGVSSARNFGVRYASGQYLIFLDDDDDFSADWLTDFNEGVQSAEGVQLVICGMKAVFSSQGRIMENVFMPSGEESWRLIIPGCWCVSKELFLRAGGYDEQLNYGENTELFFRINALKPTTVAVDKINFIYKQSVDGGSKHLSFMINANKIILEKHGEYLSRNPHVRFLYTQNIGVAYMRLRQFPEARQFLRKAYFLRPGSVLTLVRYFIACFPLLARKLYPEIAFR